MRRPPARLPAVALVLAALLGAPSLEGCASSAPRPEWTEGEVSASSVRLLWEVTRLVFEREGLPVVASGFDPKTRSVRSGWRIDLHPFRGEGFRERAEVGYEVLEDGRFRLRVRVERQTNQNIARPLDPQYADWEPAPDDVGRAQVILQSIAAMLGDRRVVE